MMAILLNTCVAMGLMALSEIATLPTPKYSMPSYAAITNNTYWKLDGDGKYLSRKVFQDEFGDEALQLVTLSGTVAPHTWYAALIGYIPFPTFKDDTGLLTFTARASLGNVTNSTLLTPVVQVDEASQSYKKDVYMTLGMAPFYQNFSIPFQFAASDPGRNSTIMLEAGYNLPQSVDIKHLQLQVWTKNQRVDPSSLPSCCNAGGYPGREANATWRKEALARIDQIRRGSMDVTVLDQNGKPISDCSINATMTQSNFRFGSAVNLGAWRGQHDSLNTTLYQQWFKKLFNTAVFEGAMKWDSWERSANTSHDEVLALVKTLRANNIRIRGHNLVWPSCGGSGKVPEDVCAPLIAENTSESRAALEKAIEFHIHDEVTTLKENDCCEEFDVVNEPYENTAIGNFLGNGNASILKWLNATAQANPNAGRRVNDDRVCSALSDIALQEQNFYKELIKWLVAEGGDLLTGFGCESHVNDGLLPGPEAMLEWYNFISSLGVSIRVTEFDMVTKDVQLYADYLRDTLIAVYSSPGADGFLMWGFTDECHWLHSAPLFYNDFRPKPGLDVWFKLPLGEWMSLADGNTNSSGIWTSPPVHHGTYNVSVSCSSGSTTISNVSVLKNHTKVVVNL
eukprot:m.343650 g.343650  ORF g.343650 m.343650 type:complete len:624 (-) comp23108_c0_seq1:185-2056(-)